MPLSEDICARIHSRDLDTSIMWEGCTPYSLGLYIISALTADTLVHLSPHSIQLLFAAA